jgi:hypothetical protein
MGYNDGFIPEEKWEVRSEKWEVWGKK